MDEPLSEEEYAEQQKEKILGFNSIPNEYGYWAGKPTLVADDAIPLMNGLDPKSWRNRENRHLDRESPLPDDMVDAITRGLKIAESDGFIAKSPAEWLVWGRRHGLDKPTMKSGNELREFDICMWPLFAQAVAEVATGKSEPGIMKKAALIAKLEAEGFASIESAFRHSEINGLRLAAKTEKHGYWHVNEAISWFEQNQPRENPQKNIEIPALGTFNQLRVTTHKAK